MLAKEEKRAARIVNTAPVCDLDVCLQLCWWDWQAKGMLSSAPAGPMGSLQNDEARRRSVCQEEILPDTAEASPVFFLVRAECCAVNFPWHCVHTKTLVFTSYYCASECSYTAKCHHYQFVLLAGWFYALSSFGKCFAGRYIFLSIKHS